MDAHARPGPAREDAGVVDWAEAMKHIPGGEAGVRRLAVLMRSECPQLLAEIAAGLKAQAAPRVRMAAHTLRGAALHFGARDTVAVATEVETSAAAGDLGAVAAALPRLRREVDRLVDALTRVATADADGGE